MRLKYVSSLKNGLENKIVQLRRFDEFMEKIKIVSSVHKRIVYSTNLKMKPVTH